MLIRLLLLFCLPTANACLQCNRRVRHLHDNMIQSSSLADELELQKIFSHGVEMFREISEKRKGVIGRMNLHSDAKFFLFFFVHQLTLFSQQLYSEANHCSLKDS